MDDLNPIQEKNVKKLDPGMYQAVLDEVKPYEGKKYKSDEPETTIKFKFDVPSEDTNMATFVKPWSSPTSQLTLLLKSMAGKEFTEAIRQDKDKLWAFAKSLQGKPYNIVVGLNKEGNPKIISATPIKGIAPTPSPIDVAPIDDIPF